MAAVAWTRLGLGRAGTARTLARSRLGRSSLRPGALLQANLSTSCLRFSQATDQGVVSPAPEQKSFVQPKPRRPEGNEQKHKTNIPQVVGALVRVEVYKHVHLSFSNREIELPRTWFRDSCACSQCVSESSGQKRFATCDISPLPEVESAKVLDDGSLELVWANDLNRGASHTSTFSPSALQTLLSPSSVDLPPRILWNRAMFERDSDSRVISYDDWMAAGKPMAKTLLDLVQWGLVIIRGVPESHDAVKHIAAKIGPLYNTFYGETWDVISKPDAENVAYTDESLCLHQDLLYMRRPPSYQLLHCLKNDCAGGDSLFSDGLRAAVEIKLTSPGAYSALCYQSVLYKYDRNGNIYHKRHSVVQDINMDRGMPQYVAWSPPFQDTIALEHAFRANAWLQPARLFRDSLEAPENMLQFRLRPGDCVVFDNMRVLHGRTRFDAAAGQRHLRGCYLDTQALLSALRRAGNEGLLGPLAHHTVLSAAASAAAMEWEQARSLYGTAEPVGTQVGAGKEQRAAGERKRAAFPGTRASYQGQSAASTVRGVGGMHVRGVRVSSKGEIPTGGDATMKGGFSYRRTE